MRTVFTGSWCRHTRDRAVAANRPGKFTLFDNPKYGVRVPPLETPGLGYLAVRMGTWALYQKPPCPFQYT